MITDSGLDRPARSPAASACVPYHEVIESALARGRNAMAIWQDLVDQHGFAGAYEGVTFMSRGCAPYRRRKRAR